MHRVALENAEEAEIVHPSQLFNQEVELLLLHQPIFILHVVVKGALLIFHGFIFTLFQVIRVSLLLDRRRRVRWRLEPAFDTQILDPLLNLADAVDV